MRHGHNVVFGSLRAIAAAALVLAVGGPGSLAAGDIIYVDADAGGLDDGSSWANAFTDLQLALDAAETGDQIWVAEGIYRPSVANGGTGDRYNSFQLINGVALYGGFAGGEGSLAERDWVLHETILSGDIGIEGDASDNSYHVFYHPPGLVLDGSAILDGFTITGGNSDGVAAHESGGGMYNDRCSPAVSNCIFSGNSAATGGGMYNDDCSPTITSCTFAGNSADYGGAMANTYSSSPELTGCTFESNVANYDGGGMHNDNSSWPELADCAFVGNSAGEEGGGIYDSASSMSLSGCTFTGNSAGTNGGGMFNNDSSPVLTGCLFSDNSASYGGGIYNIYNSSPTLDRCSFSGNDARYGGGGMFNYSGSSPILTNCAFAGNTTGGAGGAMRNYLSSPTLTNCTFSGNSSVGDGGGIYNRTSSPAVTNCILWGDTPGEVFNWDEASAPPVTYSDIQGGYEGEGNMDAYPWFVDAANGNLHLGACSPCIEAGNNTAPALPALDFEGDDRILDGDDNGTATVDMGVDEVAVSGVCFRARLPMLLKGY